MFVYLSLVLGKVLGVCTWYMGQYVHILKRRM